MGAAVLLVLVMITPSLGIYFSQRSQISRTQDDEARTRASISTLQDEVKRWHDPDYVRAQARSQLGWVMPGETGYQVIGENGKVIGSTTSLDEKKIRRVKPALTLGGGERLRDQSRTLTIPLRPTPPRGR
ncbi:cell division protein DivIC [Cutibacterium acnes JCM 18909]|nr:cell division protein DivIC [Cutibacterium acnes JCM 18909]